MSAYTEQLITRLTCLWCPATWDIPSSEVRDMKERHTAVCIERPALVRAWAIGLVDEFHRRSPLPRVDDPRKDPVFGQMWTSQQGGDK